MAEIKTRERYIPDWESLTHGIAHEPDRDQEMIAVTRETLRIAKIHLRKANSEDYYHTSGAAEDEIRSALEQEVTPKVINEARFARLDGWIKREFKFHAIAHRTKDSPKWEGEPFMSMEIAKDLVRKAVRKFQP